MGLQLIERMQYPLAMRRIVIWHLNVQIQIVKPLRNSYYILEFWGTTRGLNRFTSGFSTILSVFLGSIGMVICS